MRRLRFSSRALLPLAAAIAVAGIFLALNHSAYDGFFQDDELDNLAWTPSRPASLFIRGLLKPGFATDNFRPVGHLYFALMGRAFGLNFPPYITPIFLIHFLNGALLYLLIRKLRVERWCALAASSFFILSAAALDAYWKPMYVFDLLCTTFTLASVLLYAWRRYVLSFVAFWLAYKAKELGVMIPAVLALYEYWFGERRFKLLIPFALASLNFGIQGIVLNPNRDNPYTLHFTLRALEQTAPFYARRFLLFPLSGLLLFALALLRDRRVWFGLAAMLLVMVPLFVLPGRLFEAYAYLPLACAAVALGAAASRWNPAWAWMALALWMPFNMREIRHEKRAILDRDDQAFAFVDAIGKWVHRTPAIETFVYDGVPTGFHQWGVAGAWDIAHGRLGLPAFYASWPEGQKALAGETVAYGSWDPVHRRLAIRIRRPGE